MIKMCIKSTQVNQIFPKHKVTKGNYSILKASGNGWVNSLTTKANGIIFKMLCLYLLTRINCQIYFSLNVKILLKNDCWKSVSCKFGFLLFMFPPLTWKQFTNILTSIDMFSYFCDLEVMHQTAVWAVLGSIPGSGEDFYVCFLLCFYFLSNKHYFFMKFCNSFCNVNSISLPNILRICYLL